MIGDAVKKAQKNGGDLTTQNLKYVWKIAQDLGNKTGVEPYDLFVEGVIAMKKAEQKYDPNLNDSFVKFCSASVRGYMLNYINRGQSLVHIPVNHLQGFTKGQETKSDVSEITYDRIDSYDYDTLGTVDHPGMTTDRYEILQEGLKQLDENSRIAVKMKLRLDEFGQLEKNNMKVIAEKLEVPERVATKIYNEAMTKLKKYCQAEING